MMTQRSRRQGERGVALLIALLVTTLLMAVVVEFAYGTRVSLRAAVNFRDSQRAYYLARSGVSFAGKILAENLRNGKLQQNLERRGAECAEPLPFISTGDVALRVCWEDEAGKISIARVGKDDADPTYRRLYRLFDVQRVDQSILPRISEKAIYSLATDLRKVMPDEEIEKVRDYLTTAPVSLIDVNTASSPVLQSLGISASNASMLIEARGQNPFTDKSRLASTYGLDTTTLGMLDVTSNIFSVQSYATVGGYTKYAEAVIVREKSKFTILYWRIV
jgi:general secretion pathway protein K